MISHSDALTQESGYRSAQYSAVEDLLYRAPVGLMTITLEGIVVAHNRMLCEWLGVPNLDEPGAIVGANAFEWLTEKSRVEIHDIIASNFNGEGQLREYVIEAYKLSGEQAASILNVDRVADANGDPLLHVAMIDATDRVRFEQELVEARAAADEANQRLTRIQERMRHNALHDSLTGLPNKALLEEQLSRMLNTATRTGQTSVIMFLDLDHFRRLNAATGYPAGDAVIQEIAQRIQASCTGNEIVSRIAGDEFVIAASSVNNDCVSDLCERLHNAVKQPISIGDETTHITTSIGVVTWKPAAGEGPPHVRQLFAAADRAIYQAKQNGRNTTVVHEWVCEGK